MEARRREAARLLKLGKLSQAEIGRQLGVSRATMSDWATQLAAGGLRALQRRKASGRPGRLTPAEKQSLLRRLKRGALAAGFATERWTMARVRQFIEHEFGVHYHVQAPLPRAAERDEELVRAWLAQDWARIKKGAATRRKHRVL